MVTSIRKFFLERKNALPEELQLLFLKQLHRLLANGYPLIEALEVLSWDRQMKQTAFTMIASLKRGLAIDQAFEKGLFHRTIVAHLYFVRKSGDIVSSLQKCVDLFSQRMHHTKKLKQTSRYPLILFSIFFILLFMIKRSVLPSFTSMMTPTSVPIQLSIAFLNHIEIIGLIVCFFFFTFYMLWRFVFQRLNIHTQIKYYKHIPFYRKVLALQTSFQFATHLGALLKTDMSFNRILSHMSEQKRLPIIGYYASLMVAELKKGHYVTELLSEFDLLEKPFAVIFQKNKDRRVLEKDLSVYADILIDELQRKVLKIITIIQPLFFILLACFIILIYLTLMLPMYDLIKTI